MWMKIKKPTLSGMKNFGYLGHFAQDRYIQAGHNECDEDGCSIVDPRDSGEWTTSDQEDSIQQDRDEADAEKANKSKNTTSKSSGSFEFETKNVNGRRQHRLIRR
jgi:hypothetical protein